MLIEQQEYQTETLIHYSNIFQAISNYPRNLQPTTTLNFKYSVDKEIPNLKLDDVKNSFGVVYYGIGRNGYTINNGLRYPFRPDNTDLDLYDPLPFRCIPLGSSLTEYEKEVYRCPVPKVINGVEYICYYLKKIKQFKTDINVYSIDSNGIESIYEFSSDNLFPIPNKNIGLINLEGTNKHRGVGTEFNHLMITPLEVKDLKTFFFQNTPNVEISEWGLYSGYDDIDNKKSYNVQLAFKCCNTGIMLNSNTTYSRNIKMMIGNKLFV